MWGALAIAALVLVPADPPAHQATAVSAAGDAVALTRPHDIELHSGSTRLRVSRGSAKVASAPDGTTAIATNTRSGLLVRVHAPGEAPGRAIRLGDADQYEVAAAPGGWAAAAWMSQDFRHIEAAVIDPDGNSRHAVLDNGRSLDTFSRPRVGIDARGRTTVAWTRWTTTEDYTGTRQRVRVAHGGATYWTRAEDLGTGADPIFDIPDWALLDVKVTPAGHTAIAWATRRAIKASFDGARPQTVAAAHRPGSPTLALSDAGHAVVAYYEHGAIKAAGRAPNAPWTAPQRVSGTPGPGEFGGPPEGWPNTTSDGDDGAEDVALTSALAADGRAVIAWSAGYGVAASAGQAGGAFTAARQISLPTRASELPPTAALDAAGNPWVTWLETALYGYVGTPRGAILVPEAQAPAPDTVAPRLTAAIPSTTGLGRTSVSVTCSEACDVRVQLVEPGNDVLPSAVAARAFAAGGTITVKPLSFVLEEWRKHPPRRLRIDVLATDRAGNVARVSGTARIQGR